ncbi:hypothetical protein NHX12_022688 [Muraenolepis orangiensis]|uniref:CTCK domain-containing protein n=1 Tax=Muraenolepis orangiensis TaxID=630683 RepID=A0A9Q0EP26_9TELE|nr:hypothetical protein NHX12_022688 [Muraenolepis orangiensis]
MFWRIALPVLLAGALCITAEIRKLRPQGSFPSPYKAKGNLSLSGAAASRHARLHPPPATPPRKPDVLSSSREALVVTERRYLRSDWCKTQPLRQTVSEEGCRSRTVVNRFCYGQCNSFYIPRHMGPSAAQAEARGQGQAQAQGKGKGKGRGKGSASAGRGRGQDKAQQEPFQSCSFCRPHRVTQLTVQLECPGSDPPFKHRKVQRVKQCRCMSVDVSGPRKSL